MRTDQDSSGANIAGTGNCLNWTDRSGSNYAATVRLTSTWETPPNEIRPWDATAFSCSNVAPVWSVGDFFTEYLPLLRKK